MGGNRREHSEELIGAFLIAMLGTLLARLLLAGSLMEFLRAHIESPEVALNLASFLLGAALFSLTLFIGRALTFELERPSDQVRVRHGRGVLFLDAASVCDQVFIATSKVQGVKCSEVDVHAMKGDAHIALHVQIESAAELQTKHAELRQAIREMARRLHIRLGAEPIIHAKLPPLRGGRTVNDALNAPGLFASLRSHTALRRSSTSSIFGAPRDPFSNTPPSSLDGEAPSRPSSSIFGRILNSPKPDEPDDEQ
jgi:hypothetical protein